MRRKALQTAAVQDVGIDTSQVLQELFEEHHGMVIRTAQRITGNLTDAEDVLQTVFMRLWKRGDPGHLNQISRSYLHRAAINAALDVRRSQKPSRSVSFASLEGMLVREDRGPDQLRSAAELREWLRDALSRLNPKAAEIFVLRFFEGFGNEEIAAALGTSPGTIAVTLHRTRSRLQDELKSFFGGES